MYWCPSAMSVISDFLFALQDDSEYHEYVKSVAGRVGSGWGLTSSVKQA